MRIGKSIVITRDEASTISSFLRIIAFSIIDLEIF